MKVNLIQKDEFLDLIVNDQAELLRKIATPEAFVVQRFYASGEIIKLRETMFQRGISSEPTWHPLYDDCPDYHRLHDNYASAYVKSKMHGFYNHGWYQHNRELFDFFKEIFVMKNRLGGYDLEDFLTNVPTDGFVARVNFQHYPRGGGYIAEHIDPVGKHAHLQTLVQASQIGKDYFQGGVFARMKPGSEKVYLDEYTSPGDLIVLSPGIPHGVDPIDPELPYDWRQNDGRWIANAIVVSSDYDSTAVKPQQVSSTTAVGSAS